MSDDYEWVEVKPGKKVLRKKNRKPKSKGPGGPGGPAMHMARQKYFQTPEMEEPELMPADSVEKHDRMCEILNRDQPGRGRGPDGEWTRNTTDFIDE